MKLTANTYLLTVVILVSFMILLSTVISPVSADSCPAGSELTGGGYLKNSVMEVTINRESLTQPETWGEYFQKFSLDIDLHG